MPDIADGPPRLWTHHETAAYLDIPVSTLYALNARGDGPRSYKVGRHRRYHAADVKAWLEEHASDRSPAA